MNSADFSNLMKQNCTQYYGTAGKFFIKKLVEELQVDPDATIQELRSLYLSICKGLTPADATPEQGRIINKFAAVQTAGLLAAEFGILPYTEAEIADAVKHVLDLSLSQTTGIADNDRALVRLQDFLIRNHAGVPSIRDVNSSSPKCFTDPSKNIFIFSDEQLKAACGHSDLQGLAKELKSKGLLFINENGRYKSKHRLSGCSNFVRLYAIKAQIIETEIYVSDRDTSPESDEDNNDQSDN